MSKKKHKNSSTLPNNRVFPLDNNQQTIDAEKLDFEVPESFRETHDPISNEVERNQKNSTNWSQSQDRSEDLINERDPFTQQPELDTVIAPELIQERAYTLYEQRGRGSDSNLADWFEAERQLRDEFKSKKK